jgi:hypothetical protein
VSKETRAILARRDYRAKRALLELLVRKENKAFRD